MKTKFITLSFILLGIIGICKPASAQMSVTTIGNYTPCSGAHIAMPVTATNLIKLGAVSLILHYDPSVLTCLGDSARNSNLAGAFSINYSTPGQIAISWFSTNPATIPNGQIMDYLKFTYITGTSALVWDTLNYGNCQYADTGMNIIPATFINGSVQNGGSIPIINHQPVNFTANNGGQAIYYANATGATIFLWQVSTNGGSTWADLTNTAPYSTVTTGFLHINGATAGMNNYLYRCKLSGTGCVGTATSNGALLTVLATTTPPTMISYFGTVDTCPPADVVVPVYVTNFFGIGSISLVYYYDTAKMTYTGYQNLNSHITSPGNILVNANLVTGRVAVGWYDGATTDTIPASPGYIAGSGKLIEFLFHYKNGVATLAWDTAAGSNVYTDEIGNPMPALLLNGQVTMPGPAVTSNPADVSTIVGTNATFTVAGNNIMTYQWQWLNGITWTNLTNNAVYSGVNTASLLVTSVNSGLDGKQYRCYVTGVPCSPQYSTIATLHVMPLLPVNTTISNATTCPGQFTVPINVTSVNNVGSFMLTLNFPTNFTYLSFNSVNAGVSGTVHVSAAGNVLTITDTASSAINFGSGVLLNLVFTCASGTSGLAWDMTSGACWYKTPTGTTITSNFGNATITVNALPGFPAAVTGPNPICQGTTTGTYTTGGSANATSYVWSLVQGTTAGTVTGTSTSCTVTWNTSFTGAATLQVYGHNACGNGATPNGLLITVNTIPTVTLGTQPNLCTNSAPYTLTGGVPTGGTFSGTGVSGGIFTPSTAGTTSITYSYTSGGCTNSAVQPLVVNPTTAVTFGTVPSVCSYTPAFMLTQGTPLNGTYSGTAVTCAGTVCNFAPSVSGIGTFTLTYTYSNTSGCITSATSSIHVDACVGVDNEDHSMSLSILPNPSDGKFTVSVTNITEPMDLYIYNDLGQMIVEDKISITTNKFRKEFDLGTRPKGLYFIRLSGKSDSKLEKIILK